MARNTAREPRKRFAKDTSLRVGPLRIQCMGNTDGICEVLVIFDEMHTLIGSKALVPEEVLEEISRKGKVFPDK